MKLPLGDGEEPVDGPALVALEMVVVELADEERADVAADGFLDEGEVLRIVLVAERDAQEPAEARDDVVGEPVAVEDGEDVVLVRHERRVWDLAPGSR